VAQILIGPGELAKIGHIQLLTGAAHRHVEDAPFRGDVFIFFSTERILEVRHEDHFRLEPLEPVDRLDTHVEPSQPVPNGLDALRLADKDRDLTIPVAVLSQGEDPVFPLGSIFA
jgi:hypothetical protein